MKWSCTQVEHHLPSLLCNSSPNPLSHQSGIVHVYVVIFLSNFEMVRGDTLIFKSSLSISTPCAYRSEVDLMYFYWNKGINTKIDTWCYLYVPLIVTLFVSSSKSENFCVHWARWAPGLGVKIQLPRVGHLGEVNTHLSEWGLLLSGVSMGT